MFSQVHHCTKCGKKHFTHPAYCKPEKRIIYWWADGEWCEEEDFSEFGSRKSDDYTRSTIPIYYTESAVQVFVNDLNTWNMRG